MWWFCFVLLIHETLALLKGSSVPSSGSAVLSLPQCAFVVGLTGPEGSQMLRVSGGLCPPCAPPPAHHLSQVPLSQRGLAEPRVKKGSKRRIAFRRFQKGIFSNISELGEAELWRLCLTQISSLEDCFDLVWGSGQGVLERITGGRELLQTS